MITAAIASVGHFLPETKLTNADLEKMVDTNDEWIVSRTGVKERRILREPGKATSDMATAAARQAIEKAGITPSDVDLIIVATVTPDMTFPATACLVQDKLGCENAWGYDISAACSGFIFALATGAQFIETGKCKNVVVIGADMMSSIIDYQDRTTCILFGDGAGAVVLQPSKEGYGFIDSVEYVDGSGADLLCMPAGGSLKPITHEMLDKRENFARQDGPKVFKKAAPGMANAAAKVMERNNLTGDDIRFLVPHQANKRIIDVAVKRVGLSDDRVMMNIERYGNTTAGTIPLCLYDYEKDLRKGDKLILAAFGGGFTWGATYLTWAYDGDKI